MNHSGSQFAITGKYSVHIEAISLVMSLKTNSIITVGFTVLLSATSYGLNSTAARLLTPSETSKVVILWTAMNMAILLFQSPIEALAPRIRSALQIDQGDVSLNLLVTTYFLVSALILSVGTIAISLIVLQVSLVIALSATFFLLSYSIFYWQKVLLFARNDFSTILKKSCLVFLSALVSFGTLMVLDCSQISFLFISVAISYLLPLTFKSTQDLKELFINRSKFSASLRYFRKSGIFRDLASLIFGNAVSLLILVGGVLFAPLKELDPSQIVTYSAMISLSMVPMLVLNSLVLPMVLQAVIYVENQDYSKIWNSYLRTVSGFTCTIFLVATPYLLFGNYLIGFFIGSQYKVSNPSFFLVAIATGLAAITGVPRLLLTSIGGVRTFNNFLLISFVLYVVVVYLSPGSISAFILGSVFSSLMLLVAGTILIRQITSRNYENA